MDWTDLLFAHWRVSVDAVRAIVPPELEIDTFDGEAWVGLVPFRMERCWFRGFGWLPAAAGLRDFYECNVRTYVRYRGTPGVWFLSLDAETTLPVVGGRWMWSLNYVRSTFNVGKTGGEIDYRLKRRPGPWPWAATQVRWRVGERIGPASPGTLEHFLVERYWLFSKRFGRILGGRVAHTPWDLHRAELLGIDDGLIAAGGLKVSGMPHVMASPRIEVRGWSLGAVAV